MLKRSCEHISNSSHARSDTARNLWDCTGRKRVIRVSDFRGRKNVVLLFSGHQSDERTHELIHELASRYGEVRNENAEIVAIITGSSTKSARLKSDLHFSTVPDEQSILHRAIGAIDSAGKALAAVCIADRYGEVYAAEFCSDAGCLSADDILEWLKFIEIQCPECGVSEWPRTVS